MIDDVPIETPLRLLASVPPRLVGVLERGHITTLGELLAATTEMLRAVGLTHAERATVRELRVRYGDRRPPREPHAEWHSRMQRRLGRREQPGP